MLQAAQVFDKENYGKLVKIWPKQNPDTKSKNEADLDMGNSEDEVENLNKNQNETKKATNSEMGEEMDEQLVEDHNIMAIIEESSADEITVKMVLNSLIATGNPEGYTDWLDANFRGQEKEYQKWQHYLDNFLDEHERIRFFDEDEKKN